MPTPSFPWRSSYYTLRRQQVDLLVWCISSLTLDNIEALKLGMYFAIYSRGGEAFTLPRFRILGGVLVDGAFIKAEVEMSVKPSDCGCGMRVKVIVDCLGNTLWHPRYGLEFEERCFTNLLQATKMSQELGATSGPHTRYVLQLRP